MKNHISSRIELLRGLAEDAIIVTVDASELPTAIILLSALIFNRVDKVVFRDTESQKNIHLLHKTGTSRKDEYVLQLYDKEILVNITWFEALFSMFIDVQLNGWYQGAHLDQDFNCGKIDYFVCFSVELT